MGSKRTHTQKALAKFYLCVGSVKLTPTEPSGGLGLCFWHDGYNNVAHCCQSAAWLWTLWTPIQRQEPFQAVHVTFQWKKKFYMNLKCSFWQYKIKILTSHVLFAVAAVWMMDYTTHSQCEYPIMCSMFILLKLARNVLFTYKAAFTLNPALQEKPTRFSCGCAAHVINMTELMRRQVVWFALCCAWVRALKHLIGSCSVKQIFCAEKLQHSRNVRSLTDDEGKRLHRHWIRCEPSPSFKVILNIIRFIFDKNKASLNIRW